MPSEGVVATLRAGWDALDRVDAAQAVIGGLALTAWRHARQTRDADVLVAIDEGRFDELLVAHELLPGVVPRERPARELPAAHEDPPATLDGHRGTSFHPQAFTMEEEWP